MKYMRSRYLGRLISVFLFLFFTLFSPKQIEAQSQELVTSGVVFNTDSSANSARSRNTEIRVPVNLINPTQGWVALRMKMGFPSTTSLSPDPNIWDMSESDPSDLFFYYDVATDTFHLVRRRNGTGGTAISNSQTGAQSFVQGDFRTLIAAWTSTTLRISVNGGPFTQVTVSSNTIPAQAPFQIGSSLVQGDSRQPNSDYYWVAAGTGTLTDANASAIHSFANGDKRRVDFPGTATFIWWANDDLYNNDGAVIPTQPQGTVPGDANGDRKVDGIDFSIWLSHYNQNVSGPSNGDFNNSGKVDGIDFSVWLSNYGTTSQVTNTLTPTRLPNATVTPTRAVTNTPIPATPTRAATPTPLPTGPIPTVPPSSGSGIWISAARIAQLPTTGTAWDSVRSAAYGSWGSAQLSNQDMSHDTNTLAGALVYAKTGDASLRTKVADAVMSAIETENGGRTLALGRNLASYVIAADLINLKQFRAADDTRFRTWLSGVRRETLDGMTLIECHEKRPNNWGTHCGSSRAAADVYLGDTADLARTAQVFKGFLGDRASYASFTYGELDWQCNPSTPVGINPVGCTKNGQNIDGVIPDDQRRSGGFSWPPPKANYVYGNLSGAITQANILHNAGYDAWNWQSQALKRAYVWLHTQANFTASGDDAWQPHLVNYIYGTSFPASAGSGAGKHMGWTDWTHGR
jgi:hypothetical protein